MSIKKEYGQKSTKIPTKLTIARRSQKDGLAPLGYMIEYGTTKTHKTQLENANRWAKRYDKHGDDIHSLEPIHIDNESMFGFIIPTEIHRFTTSNVVWRVLDPRGFEVEISSENLAILLAECTISKGVIEEELIWGRQGGKIVLIPLVSEWYTIAEAQKLYEMSNLSIRDVKPGNTGILSNSQYKGYPVTYLGYFYSMRVTANGVEKDTKKRHYFGIDDETRDKIPGYKNMGVFSYASPKIGKILDRAESEISDNVRYINEQTATWQPYDRITVYSDFDDVSISYAYSNVISYEEMKRQLETDNTKYQVVVIIPRGMPNNTMINNFGNNWVLLSRYDFNLPRISYAKLKERAFDKNSWLESGNTQVAHKNRSFYTSDFVESDKFTYCFMVANVTVNGITQSLYI